MNYIQQINKELQKSNIVCDGVVSYSSKGKKFYVKTNYK